MRKKLTKNYSQKELDWLAERDTDGPEPRSHELLENVTKDFNKMFRQEKTLDAIRRKLDHLRNKDSGASTFGFVSSGSETDLSVFLNTRKKISPFDNHQNIVKFVQLYRKGWRHPALRQRFKCGSNPISQLRSELRQAAKQGYTLERYLKENRPFDKRRSKQVILK